MWRLHDEPFKIQRERLRLKGEYETLHNESEKLVMPNLDNPAFIAMFTAHHNRWTELYDRRSIIQDEDKRLSYHTVVVQGLFVHLRKTTKRNLLGLPTARQFNFECSMMPPIFL